MKVGTRELKNRLSYYLRRVREGEAVFVTDRGTVVAELRPAQERGRGTRKTDRQVLLELAAAGFVTLGTGQLKVRAFLKGKPGKPLSAMIAEDRR